MAAGGWRIAIVGATGAVGRTMLKILEQRTFPVSELRLLARPGSTGKVLRFKGEAVEVQALSETAFEDCDIALFSAGSSVSTQWVSLAAQHCGVVVDNSSCFRMHKQVPLIVPEVNPQLVSETPLRIIANPNCSTIQLVVALKPLYDRYGIRRVVVSTYQAVSGAGQKGIDQLRAELNGEQPAAPVFPHPIAGNALPQIAAFNDDGYTQEEWKMIVETKKIFNDEAIAVAPTCVRVPVLNSHSEAVHVELLQPFLLDEVREVLRSGEGITLVDDPGQGRYPLARDADDHDDVFVGRLRRDPTVRNGLAMWIVSDNLRKGAATNAVQIAELWANANSA